jgi:small subunit ribosomal protein S16
MVVVRLQRLGTKKAPHHRVVVTQQQRAQSGRVLEVVGFYDPSFEPPKLSIKTERVQYWVQNGAQVSEALQKLLRRQAKSAAVAAKK